MRRRTLTLGVVFCACLGLLGGRAEAADTKLSMAEECSFKLLPKDGVALRTTFTVKNGGRKTAASIRFVAGWNIGRLYLKAESPTTLRLAPGRKAQRTVTRTLPHAPELSKALRKTGTFHCASIKTYTVS
jgi:hypothetical protein